MLICVVGSSSPLIPLKKESRVAVDVDVEWQECEGLRTHREKSKVVLVLNVAPDFTFSDVTRSCGPLGCGRLPGAMTLS
jgi:hypothetical protein